MISNTILNTYFKTMQSKTSRTQPERLLHFADRDHECGRFVGAHARGDIRPSGVRDLISRRGRGDRTSQQHAIWTGRHGLDP